MPLPRTALLLALLLPACTLAPRLDGPGAPPPTASVPQVDLYHGVAVPDPYRWLEDLDAPETRAWVAAQNRYTEAWLGRLPARQAFRERLEQLWDYERWTAPERRGERLFFFHNDGLQNQSVLYVLDEPEGEPRPLLDPNTLSPDGTVALMDAVPDPDGRYLAYALSDGGSDWREWHVLDVEQGTETGDLLRWSKFSSVAWAPDGSGFWYGRYPEPPADQALAAVNRDQRLCFHRLGTPQEEDEVVLADPEHPDRGYQPLVSEDGRWLLVLVGEGTDPRNLVLYRDLAGGGELRPLVADFEALYEPAGNQGSRWFFRTDRDAPRGRVLAVDLGAPEPRWEEVVPEDEDTLRGAALLGGRLVLHWMHDATSRLTVHALDGQLLGAVPLPAPGTVSGLQGRQEDRDAWFRFTSFTVPPSILRLDLETLEVSTWRRPEVPFDAAPYATEQVWYTSRDGTRVPMFLVHRRDLLRDGRRPVWLYGYGGFDISLTPSWRIPALAWIERGGIFAMPNLRGGGEFGREWHEAGILDRKQNVFDDFIAAAEWLVAAGWTAPEHIAIAGGSNGGLLVGACLTQRPDLFGAALPAVGVLDMLRYHRFTIGWAWASDYGTSDDPEQFRFLRAWSPLHNLHPGVHYPATLITTGDHDDRVVPAHSFKFAAALQKAQGGPAPVLIRITTRAGHGAGKPTDLRIAEAADRLAFAWQAVSGN